MVAARTQRPLRACIRIAFEARRIRSRGPEQRVVLDRNQWPYFRSRVVGDPPGNRQLRELALRSKIYSANGSVSALASCRCSGSNQLLDFSRRNNFRAALVRHCAGHYRIGIGRETGSAVGGKIVTLLAFVLILLALLTFVAGQIFLKHAMESTTQAGLQKSSVAVRLGAGILLMTISFFITLGLLQRFDLSYLYPFQGLSIIIISLIAALILKEKLSWRLMIGVLFITAGVVLVSMS